MTTTHEPSIQILDSGRWIDLERADARQRALEDAARLLERHDTNELYHKALKMAAALIRAMKHAA